MSLYWKDITTHDNKWRGIKITVDDSYTQQSNFHIESCSKRFFTVNYENQTLFWARQHYTHYGVALIKNYHADYQVPIVAHINSSDIEERKALKGSEKFKSWSKYFIQSLNRIDNHFFTHGKWIITPFMPHDKESSWMTIPFMPPDEENMKGIFTKNKNESSKSNIIFDALNTDTFQYLSWFKTPNKDVIFIGLKHVDEKSGRLKWWRKKAREGTLPPILLYYISGLSGYILLDGHYRLKAAQLENIVPDIIELSTYRVEKFNRSSKIQQGILKSLENRQTNKRKKHLQQDELNRILIDAYTKEDIYTYSRSKATQVPIQLCLRNMIQFLDKINKIEYAQKLFDETDGIGW